MAVALALAAVEVLAMDPKGVPVALAPMEPR
jgi:hypothetical protein